MKKLPLIFLIALVIASCKDVKEPVFEDVSNIKVGKAGITETNVSANLHFTNSNSFGFSLKKIDCDLYVDSSFLGHFSNTNPVRIAARNRFVIPLAGNAQTLVLMNQGAKTFAGKQSLIQVKGKARVGRSGIYRTIPINFVDTIMLKF